MSALRFGLRLLALLAALVAGLALHGTWRLFRARSPWPRRFLGWVSRIVGARVRVEGAPLRDRVVFVSNHLSWIDIPLLAGVTGTAFVSKAEVKRTPVVGFLADLNRTVYVAREDRLGVAGQIARLREALDEVPAVTLFPEGTTGDGRTLKPFKASLLAMLDPPPPGVRVQPVRIDYGDAPELAWTGDEPGARHARRVLSRPGRFTATLRFLEPFDPAVIGNRKAIAAEARRRIEAAGSGSGGMLNGLR